MKTNTNFAALILACLGLTGGLPPAAVAGLPQPMCIYYGQACDGYGLPYTTNASVILLHGTNEIARHTIGGSLSPGVNFALNVHLDDGRSATDYSPRALHSGDFVSIVVRDQQGQKTIMESQVVPSVGKPGDIVTVNVTAATDADNDGLPDQWEMELIAWSDGQFHTLNDVVGSDDFDGDGMSNLEEYRAGTFAFLDYDYFYIEQGGTTPNRHLCLTVLSVPGKIYSALCATNLAHPTWQTCSFSLTDTGPLQVTPAEGNGNWLSLYIPIDEPARFFRLTVR